MFPKPGQFGSDWGKQTITAGAGSHVYFPIENTVGGKFQSLIYQTTELHKKSSSGGSERQRWSEEKVPQNSTSVVYHEQTTSASFEGDAKSSKKGTETVFFSRREFFTPLLLAAAVTASEKRSKPLGRCLHNARPSIKWKQFSSVA